MKKGVGISLLCLFLTSGCLGVGKKEDDARARIATRNAKSVIASIRYNYTLDKLTIPIGTPIDILSLEKAELKVDGGTSTMLSDKADSDLSQIRLDDVIIDGHTCSGTTDHMKCKKIEK